MIMIMIYINYYTPFIFYTTITTATTTAGKGLHWWCSRSAAEHELGLEGGSICNYFAGKCVGVSVATTIVIIIAIATTLTYHHTPPHIYTHTITTTTTTGLVSHISGFKFRKALPNETRQLDDAMTLTELEQFRSKEVLRKSGRNGKRVQK